LAGSLSRPDSLPSSVPLWWDPSFLALQRRQINLFFRSGLVIPYVEESDRVEVGFVGPYSGAFPLDSVGTSSDFLEAWEDFRNDRSRSSMVRLPPRSHFPEIYDINKESLGRLGATIFAIETNHTIDLEFFQGFDRNRRRHLRDPCLAEAVTSEVRVAEAYELLLANRLAKGYSMTMTREELQEIEAKLPHAIKCLMVHVSGEGVAASISFQVSAEIAYVFMWGGNPHSPCGSPGLTMLAKELVDRNLSAGVKRMCLGTSSFGGIQNVGLSRFKESLGALPEPKITLRMPGSVGV